MQSARISLIVLSLFLSVGIASAGFFSRKKPTELAVRTTAYTHSEADHLEYGRKTAAGGTLKYSRKYSSAAADWSKFPLGTKFKIDGMNTTFVVDDYGSALVGTETIDIYKPSRSAMNQWGVKHVDIKILEYGDYEKSREILEERTKYAHVRQMLAGIKRSPGPKPQKKSKSVFRRKPSISANTKSDRTPAKQLASAPPKTPKPAPDPASAKPAVPTAPVIAPLPIPSSDSAPTFAAARVRENAARPESEPPAPKSEPSPRPSVSATALRKVRPLQFAKFARSSSPAEPPAAEAPARDKATATPPRNQLRKRTFRPLIASVNG